MSPLANSLLALATLLAAADAQNGWSVKQFGRKTDQVIPHTLEPFSPGGDQLSVQDLCPYKYGSTSTAVGEEVTASTPNMIGEAPEISLLMPPALSPVVIRCPDGCPNGGGVFIMQYCD